MDAFKKLKFELGALSVPLLLILSAFLGVSLSYGKVYLFHIMIGVYALVCLPKLIKNRQLTIGPDVGLFALFTLWYALSGLWSQDPVQSIKFACFPFFTMVIIFVVQNHFCSKERFLGLLKWLTLIAGAHLLFSLLEMFTPFRLPISSYSDIVTFFKRIPSPMLKTEFRSYFLSHPTSFFWDQNSCSLLTLMLLPFCLFFKNRWVKLLGIAATFLIILYSSSRGLLVISIMLTIFYIKYTLLTRRNYQEAYLIVMLTLGSTWLFLDFGDKDKIYEIVESAKVFKNYAESTYKVITDPKFKPILEKNTNKFIYHRIVLIQGGIHLVRANPLLGISAGSLAKENYTYRKNTYPLSSVHNYWLEIMIEGGIPLFLCYFAWLICKLILLFKSQNIYPFWNIRMALMSSAVVFFVGVISLSSGIYFLPKSILYALIACYPRIKPDPR